MASRVLSQKGKHRIIANIPCSVDVPIDRPIDVSASEEKCGRSKAVTICKFAQ